MIKINEELKLVLAVDMTIKGVMSHILGQTQATVITVAQAVLMIRMGRLLTWIK